MRTTVGLLAVAAVLLAGCSGDDGGDGGDGGGSPKDEKPAGPLGDLDGDTLCEMVDRAVVEKQFGEPIAQVLGGVEPKEHRGSVVCQYTSKAFVEADTDDLDKELQASTIVTVSDAAADTPKDALGHYMRDMGEKVAYHSVTGLGLVAGYASSEFDVRSGGSQLATIIEVDGAFLEVVVKAEPEGTLNQLRPIADELVKDVENQLR